MPPPLEEELHSQLQDIQEKLDTSAQTDEFSKMSDLLKDHQIPVLEAVCVE
jgi:hypothetical protein